MIEQNRIKVIILIVLIFILVFEVAFLVIMKTTNKLSLNQESVKNGETLADLPPSNSGAVNNEENSGQVCVVDEDCDYLECVNEKGYPICYLPEMIIAKKRCVDKVCECKCEVPSLGIPSPPTSSEVIYEGDVYVKTDKIYYEYIPDSNLVILDDGSAIYFFHNTVLTVYAIDIHHGYFSYLIWEKK